jgi:hypothetical protein
VRDLGAGRSLGGADRLQHHLATVATALDLFPQVERLGIDLVHPAASRAGYFEPGG